MITPKPQNCIMYCIYIILDNNYIQCVYNKDMKLRKDAFKGNESI